MSDSVTQLIDRVCRLKPDWDPAFLSTFLFLEGGYSNHNYRFDYHGQRYVLRVPRTVRSAADRELERRIYAGGRPSSMPEVVAFDETTGHLISRWVPGRLLADLGVTGDELADYLRDLHAQMPIVERIYDPVAEARRHLEQTSAPRWVEDLAVRLRWAPQAVKVCHNDLNPWNVIRHPTGEWVTLDWEWAGRNDPLFDLVNLHQGADLDQSMLPALAERYFERPVEPARLHDCLTAFWLRETAWAMAEVAAGNDRPEVAEQQRLGLTRLEDLRLQPQPCA
jgi:aminoglycoside phosphotransferase (APT) family kinase protein